MTPSRSIRIIPRTSGGIIANEGSSLFAWWQLGWFIEGVPLAIGSHLPLGEGSLPGNRTSRERQMCNDII